MADLEQWAHSHWKSVVFCKECKHYKKIKNTRMMGCEVNSFMGVPMKKDPDHYCADGVRKDKNE